MAAGSEEGGAGPTWESRRGGEPVTGSGEDSGAGETAGEPRRRRRGAGHRNPKGRNTLTPVEETPPITAEAPRRRRGATSCVARKADAQDNDKNTTDTGDKHKANGTTIKCVDTPRSQSATASKQWPRENAWPAVRVTVGSQAPWSSSFFLIHANFLGQGS
uniref:Uncharacterized protein n=1 Tax=Mustela putorius furo TaxID=9669 RepID=M3Y543_MUSPF